MALLSTLFIHLSQYLTTIMNINLYIYIEGYE